MKITDDRPYNSPRWSYELLDCSMPMSFDTYSNCAHQCLYCFSFFQRAIGLVAEDYLHHRVRAVDVEKVKRMFIDPDQYGGQFRNYIKMRGVLQWGGLSDGFDWYEKKFGVSYKLLEFWNSIDYPVSISTKGVWHVYDPKYRELYRGAKNQHWKYSIITSNEEHVKAIEPGVMSSAERFKAMYELNKLGVAATTLRFRPYIIGVSDKTIPEMMKMAADSGCISVTTELLGWESRASNTSRERLQAISKVVGYDLWDFYIKNSSKTSGLLRLNYDLKREHILRCKEEAEKNGLKFFVSDAHMKEYSYHAGCCGLPENGPLSVTNKGQFAEAILIAKRRGFVQWKDISTQAYEIFNETPFFKAEGFPNSSEERAKHRYHSMYDYMHDMWNTPNSYMSPNRYFGGALVAGDVDEDGDIIYLYNKPFIERSERVGTVNQLALELRMAGKPNEERYNEVTADGTQWGHIAYPVYVVSRGRWTTATTMKLLDAARISYTLVVPKKEVKFYEKYFPHADIAVVKATGAGAARHEVIEQCRADGYESYVWILDDDISDIRETEQGKPVSMRQVFSDLEAWLEDYSNVAMIGVSTDARNMRNIFAVNQYVHGLMLVNLNTKQSFYPQYKVYEDIEFQLRLLTAGWTTVVHNRYVIDFAKIGGGGASSMYLQNVEAGLLAQEYPDSVSEQQDGGIAYPYVEWDNFQTHLKSLNVEKLLRGE